MTDKKITVIIIEDDDEAISLLEIYLRVLHEVEIVDKTTNPAKGLKLLKKNAPDIVFLDIDMPEINGIEVAQFIRDNRLKTEIVFTTGYKEYALRALDAEPLDYLLKPFGPEDLIPVINRFLVKVKKKELERRMDLFMKNNKTVTKVKFPTRTGIIILNPDDVMLLRAESNYCRIFLNNGKDELVTININNAVSLIDSENIVKASRSAFINLQYLKKIEKKGRHCTLMHKDLALEEQINKSSFLFLEQLNCFQII